MPAENRSVHGDSVHPLPESPNPKESTKSLIGWGGEEVRGVALRSILCGDPAR